MFRIFRHYRPEIRRHFWWLAGGVAAITGVVAANATIPFVFRRFAELLASAPETDRVEEMGATILLFALLYASVWLCWRLFSICIVIFEARAMRDLDNRCFAAVQAHSLHFFENSFSGSLVKKIHRFVRAFEQLFDWLLFSAYNTGMRLGVTLVVFALHEPVFAAVFAGWICIFTAINILVSLYTLRYDKKAAAADSAVGAACSDSFAGIVAVKAFARESEEQKRFARASNRLYRKRRTAWIAGSLLDALQGVMILGLEFVLLWLMAIRWQRGEFAVQDFVFFQTFILLLLQLLWDFGRQLRRMFTAIADSTEMADLLELEPEIKDAPKAAVLAARHGTIGFRSVGFSYTGKERQFDDFSLEIPAGQRVAFVGHTGAGKSTLVKLLFRFYEVQVGAILIDGQNITEVTQDSLRRNLSLVSQQPELFHRSLKENIIFGKPDATDEEIREAARRAQILDFIESLPKRFDTVVGERGVKLSGGEKQRIAIAQAFLENAPILVLDEATSALDSLTEGRVQAAIAELLKNRTCLVIAHRLSTIQHMDRIVVLEHGRIIEDGRHDQLLRQQGTYARMWQHQTGGFL